LAHLGVVMMLVAKTVVMIVRMAVVVLPAPAYRATGSSLTESRDHVAF